MEHICLEYAIAPTRLGKQHKIALIDQLCLNQFHMLHSNMKREQTYSKYLYYTEYHTGTIRHCAD